MRRAYSVAQIRFECLSYIKEFGALPSAWTAGTCTEIADVLRERFDGEAARCLWLAKPALTPRAARTVVDMLHAQYGVCRTEPEPNGSVVFLVRPVALAAS